MSDNAANLSKESRRILNDEPFPGSPDDMMDTIAALRARVAKLEAALKFYAEDCGSYARAALSETVEA